MSSSLIVEVCRIKNICHHPAADKLDLSIVKGWQVVVGRDQFKEDDLIVYIPMDAVIPTELADEWNVRNYLGGQNKDRVRCARLRGEMSYGLIMPNSNNWAEGEDVAKHFGITKHIPPLRVTAADAAPRDIMFPEFTDVENINNFPEAFVDGEEVIVTEKIDGSCDRIGFSITRDGDIDIKAGSMSYKRTMPLLWDLPSNPYWYPLTTEPVVKLLKFYSGIMKKEFEDNNLIERNITLFGEVYGGSIRGGHKSMDYGTPTAYGFAAYGLKVDDIFIDWNKLQSLCARFRVPTVPVIAKITFNMEELKKLVIGNSLLAQQNGKIEHIREGIVIYPIKERRDPKLGRCILKMLNPDFLIMKNKREAKGEEVDFKDE